MVENEHHEKRYKMAHHQGGNFDRGYNYWKQLLEITMDNLPNIIPTALIHIINTLESDSGHKFQWKITRNLEKISLFVKSGRRHYR